MDTPFRYDAANCALILVDLQNDFCHPDGSVSKAGQNVSAAVTMLPRLQALVAAARAASVPVIFVRTTHDETNDSVAWLNRYAAGPGAVTTQLTCRTGSWAPSSTRWRLSPARSSSPSTATRRSSVPTST